MKNLHKCKSIWKKIVAAKKSNQNSIQVQDAKYIRSFGDIAI